MQTFMPYSDFILVAKCLDYRRLGKQRVEAMQILNVLLGKSKGNGWKKHPAVLMWRGFEDSLRLYHDTMIREWKGRGYNNTMKLYGVGNDVRMPNWLGDIDFHHSHRSNLIRKKPEYYGKMWPDIPNDLEYIWPL